MYDIKDKVRNRFNKVSAIKDRLWEIADSRSRRLKDLLSIKEHITEQKIEWRMDINIQKLKFATRGEFWRGCEASLDVLVAVDPY